MTPSRRVRREDFPSLHEFVAGYLHEDFVSEHKTPAGAVRAIGCDSSAEENRRLQADAARFLALTDGWPWRDLRRGFLDLGGAWAPRSRAALTAFLSAIAGPARR